MGRLRQEALAPELGDEAGDLRRPFGVGSRRRNELPSGMPGDQGVPDVGARSVEAIKEAGRQISDDHFIAEILENDFRTGSGENQIDRVGHAPLGIS